MEKDLRIYENVAKDCEFICALEGNIVFFKRNNTLNKEIEKELEEFENRLTFIYQELPQQITWDQYQKLIKEYEEINLKLKKLIGNK
jgi:hypothetical protein